MFADHLDRLDEAVMTHLGDGHCDYHGRGFTAVGIDYILDRDFDVQDENQVARYDTTISVLVSAVATSRQGDTIATPDRQWTVQELLEDDGRWRRLWVS